MERHIYPKLGNKPIESITALDIEKVLVPLYQKIPQMAIIMRKRLDAVMKRAVIVEYRVNNPVPAILGYIKEEKGKHFKASHHSEVKGIIQTIQESTRGATYDKAFITVDHLHGLPTWRGRNITKDDVDFETKTWNRPANKMKAGKAHSIPLSDVAVEVLKQAYASKTHEKGSQSIFNVTSTGTLSKALKRLGVGVCRA